MGVADVRVLGWQAEFLHCVEDVAGVVGGLGSGKTFIACNWFIDRCMNYPEGRHVIVGKDLPQLKRGTLASLKSALIDREIEFSYNTTSGQIRILETGCEIEAMSAGNHLGFRSLEADTIWADELADWGKSGDVAFVQYLVPRLRVSPRGKQYLPENGGDLAVQLRFTTNPPISTLHWLYELLVKQNFCLYWNVSLRDNILMGTQLEAYIDRQERSMAPNLWPILIDGQWGNATVGNVYSVFDRVRHGSQPSSPLLPAVYNPLLPILWTLDFNVDYMSSVICQMHVTYKPVDPRYRSIIGFVPERVQHPGYQPSILYAIDEMRLEDKGAPDVVAEFIKRYRARGWKQRVILYGDASGSGRSQQVSSSSSARSNWTIIFQELRAAGIQVEVRLPGRNPPIRDRVNAVNAQLGPKGDDRGFVINCDAAPHLAVDLETVDWTKDGRGDIDKTDIQLTHLSDALGYLIWMERQLSQQLPVSFKGLHNL